MQFRGPLTVALILFLSFAMGYKGDALARVIERVRGKLHGQSVAATPEPASANGAQLAAPASPPVNSGLPTAVVPMTPPGAKPGQLNPPPVIVPGGPPPNSLSNTLDAVRPTELSDELKAQRNVYFDRLQQQLADMKQQQQQQPEPESPAVLPGQVPQGPGSLPAPGGPAPVGPGATEQAPPQVFGQQVGAPPGGVVPNAYPVVNPPRAGKPEDDDDVSEEPAEDPAGDASDEVLDEDA